MPKLKFAKIELFQTIRNHFLHQQSLAWDKHQGTCKYRTDDGRKCAVGALIPDELYLPKYESCNVKQINAIARETFGELLFEPEFEPLLTLIQNIHDSIAHRFQHQPTDGLNLFLEQLSYLSMREAANA